MRTSIYARLTALLTGVAPVTAALAHPGHQHNSGLIERVQHALATEWGPVLLLAVIGIGALTLWKKWLGD